MCLLSIFLFGRSMDANHVKIQFYGPLSLYFYILLVDRKIKTYGCQCALFIFEMDASVGIFIGQISTHESDFEHPLSKCS